MSGSRDGRDMTEITIDRRNKLVVVKPNGFFSPESATESSEEVRAAIRTLGKDAGDHLTLYDMSAVMIATRPTMDRFIALFAEPAIRSIWARKLAFVSPSALARLQLGRLRTVRADIGIFATREEALDWLLAD